MKIFGRWYVAWLADCWAYCLSQQICPTKNGYICEMNDEGLVVGITPDCQLY